jgi:phage terminase large subunit GpA-like protein
MQPIELVRHKALQALKPPPVLPLADWIEANVRFPATVSATPGAVRLWAYQRGICDAIDDPAIERVTVIKSARIGYTSLLTGVIASFVSSAWAASTSGMRS